MVSPCRAEPLSLRQGSEKMLIRGCEQWVETSVFDTYTFGLQWKPSALEPWTGSWRRGVLLEYCRQAGQDLLAITPQAVPDETGLRQARFPPAMTNDSYTSPETEDSVWKKPGPKAGPFQARLSDGSVVTYSWYRFMDQPAMQNADLSDAEKERLQSVAGQIHLHWTMNKDYLPPPGMGTLATLDSSLIVTPPKGLEFGCVPIVTRQVSR